MSVPKFRRLIPYLDIIVLYLISLFVIISGNGSFIQFGGAILLLFFVPGYFLLFILYPSLNSLNFSMRFLLSFGSSVVLSGLLFLIISYSIGLNPLSIFLTSITLISILGIVAMIRRLPLQKEDFKNAFRNFGKVLKPKDFPSFARLISITILIVIFASYLGVTNKNSARFSEFFILGEKGLLADYKSAKIQSEIIYLNVGIINHEEEDTTYAIIGETSDMRVGAIQSIMVKNGDTWTGKFPIKFSILGKNQPIDIYLYKGRSQSPYRSFRYWIDVVPDYH
jgi:uncharacterized membrane protein